MYRQTLLMSIATGNNPVAPGTLLTTDSNSARVLTGYFPIGLTGPTSARPVQGDPDVNLSAGSVYYDTTLSEVIYYDGAGWRDVTGASV